MYKKKSRILSVMDFSSLYHCLVLDASEGLGQCYYIQVNFLYCSDKGIALSTLREQKLSLLTSLLNFMYWFCNLVHGFFRIQIPIHIVTAIIVTSLKAISKSNRNLFAIASKSDKERQLERERQRKCPIVLSS